MFLSFLVMKITADYFVGVKWHAEVSAQRTSFHLEFTLFLCSYICSLQSSQWSKLARLECTHLSRVLVGNTLRPDGCSSLACMLRSVGGGGGWLRWRSIKGEVVQILKVMAKGAILAVQQHAAGHTLDSLLLCLIVWIAFGWQHLD